MKSITFKSAFRVLSGVLFLVIGLFHFYDYQFMAVFVPLPVGSKFFVILSGALISISALGIIVNRYFSASMITLGITLALTGLMVGIPAILREPDAILRMLALSNMTKIGLAFCVLLALAFSSKK
jgi:uncharacterized membrane protein